MKSISICLVFLLALVPVYGFNCTNALIDCSNKGVCADSRTCICNDGYITFQNNPVVQCNYKQTKIIGPFLAQFFIGWFTGVGCFMLHELGYGLAQLLIFVLCPVVFYRLAKYGMDNTGMFIAVASFLTLDALWITTLVKIGTFQFTDANGAPMVDWV